MSDLMVVEGKTQITKETIKAYLCPNATDSELVLAVAICNQTGMNPLVGDVNFIKYDKTKPMQIVTRKDWFFKVANKQPNYEGIKNGIIVFRDGEIVYQVGAFLAPGDTLLGGWAEVYITGRMQHRSEVSLSEYDKKQSLWLTKKATMINKVAKVQALRESFPEKFQGIFDESEISTIQEIEKKPAIEMPTRKQAVKETEVIIEDEKQKGAEVVQPKAELACSKCTKSITKEEKEFSYRNFKRDLCRDCQSVERANRNALKNG